MLEYDYSIKPTDDYIFKRIFGAEENKDILLSFLNALFKVFDSLPRLKSVTINNSEMSKDDDIKKTTRLDIKATSNEGDLIDIEMQSVDTGNLAERAVSYLSQMVVDNLRQGRSYEDNKAISIWIVKNKLREDNPYYKRKSPIEISQMHSPANELDEAPVKSTDKITIIWVFLSKIKPDIYNIDIENWTKFIADMNTESKNKELNKAKGILNNLRSDKKVKEVLDARRKFELHWNTDLDVARSDGIKKGIEKGLKIGKEEGLIEGKKEGLIEGEKNGLIKASVVIAKNMKAQGLENDFIAKCLNISEKEVEKLVI